MSLLRAAFETQDAKVVLFTVLCAGCLQDIRERRGGRCWTAPLKNSGGYCEFCIDEARQAL